MNYKIKKALGLGMEVTGIATAIVCAKYDLHGSLWGVSGIIIGSGIGLREDAIQEEIRAQRGDLQEELRANLKDKVGE